MHTYALSLINRNLSIIINTKTRNLSYIHGYMHKYKLNISSYVTLVSAGCLAGVGSEPGRTAAG